MITAHEAGCWVDGARGHEMIRMVMGNILANLYRHGADRGPGVHWPEVEPIIQALDGDMTDDVWEETEALDWMNKACEEGVWFEMEDGDLMLLREEEPDAA